MDVVSIKEHSARAPAWVASILTVISVGTLVGLFVLATLPALVGLATAATGVRGNNPYRTLNRAMLAVCALVITVSVPLSLLLVSAGGTTPTTTPAVVVH